MRDIILRKLSTKVLPQSSGQKQWCYEWATIQCQIPWLVGQFYQVAVAALACRSTAAATATTANHGRSWGVTGEPQPACPSCYKADAGLFMKSAISGACQSLTFLSFSSFLACLPVLAAWCGRASTPAAPAWPGTLNAMHTVHATVAVSGRMIALGCLLLWPGMFVAGWHAWIWPS